MPLIILNAKIANREAIVGMGRRWPRVTRASLKAVAKWWIEKKFHGHFTSGNAAKYHHDPRSRFYKIVTKREEGEGDGREFDLILKGKSKRWLWASAAITGTQHSSVLRMKAPAYFTDPHLGRVEKEVKDRKNPGRIRNIVINITRQPDKVRELTEISIADKNDMQEFLERDMSMRARAVLMGLGVFVV